jgi:hypothetical protein
VKFESATDLVVIPSDYSADRGRAELTNVIEIGGQVIDLHGDTLVIEPSYAVILDSERGGRMRVLNRPGTSELPSRVAVINDARTRVQDYRRPENSFAWTDRLIPIGLTALVAFLVLHHFWHS